MKTRQLSIVGSRGIPARHGGFETFAEKLALYLVSKGWDISVYCQIDGPGKRSENSWRGIRRINIPVSIRGAAGTIIFDWKSTWHAAGSSQMVLTLGYNTAIFSLLYRLKDIPNIINMDGLEWQREKWNRLERVWLWLNDRAARRLGNHLIADHPEIESYLAKRTPAEKITMIPYGADVIENADAALLKATDLSPYAYCLVIARLEPENSILDIVAAWSAKNQGQTLVILGEFDPDRSPFHQELHRVASSEIRFAGAIHNRATVSALRHFATLYIHGHRVGGTNPSLLEAMAAGRPVLAHDNRFNRWVTGDSASYFRDSADLGRFLDQLSADRQTFDSQLPALRKRQQSAFCWEQVLAEYEQCLSRFAPVPDN